MFENFEAFETLHPARVNLRTEQMIKDGLSTPLHQGAQRCCKKKGWM